MNWIHTFSKAGSSRDEEWFESGISKHRQQRDLRYDIDIYRKNVNMFGRLISPNLSIVSHNENDRFVMFAKSTWLHKLALQFARLGWPCQSVIIRWLTAWCLMLLIKHQVLPSYAIPRGGDRLRCSILRCLGHLSHCQITATARKVARVNGLTWGEIHNPCKMK